MNHNNDPNRSNRPHGDGKEINERAIHSASSSQDAASLQQSQNDEDDGNGSNMSLLALLSRGSSLPGLRTPHTPLPPSLRSSEVDPPVASSPQDPLRFLRSILDQAIHAMDRHHRESSENNNEGAEVQLERCTDDRRRAPKQ